MENAQHRTNVLKELGVYMLQHRLTCAFAVCSVLTWSKDDLCPSLKLLAAVL